MYGSLSRFVPAELRELFDSVSPGANSPCESIRLEGLPTVDVMARVRQSF
jgi:hypothetical protein